MCLRRSDYWRDCCGAGSAGVGTLVGWATGASSDPGPLLPTICLSPSSGWFSWWSWPVLPAAGRRCPLRWGGGLSGGFPQCFSWSASLGPVSRRRTLPPGRVEPLATTVWRWFEVGAKAWTTTSADVVPFLKASFPTSSPTVLDVVGENLPWRATLLALLVSFPPSGHY